MLFVANNILIMTMNNNPAGLIKRFFAFFVDFLIIYLTTFLVFYFITKIPWTALEHRETYALYFVYIATQIIYFTILQANGKNTIGKIAMQIRVVTTEGESMSYMRSALRAISAFLTLAHSGSAVIIIFTKKRLALHDMICRTMVVKNK
ncbi:RDD family protein [Candidatus Peribacteria bacterium]|nr:RDD family protein [Candidatus Peribacteria bacterium]